MDVEEVLDQEELDFHHLVVDAVEGQADSVAEDAAEDLD